ncbi:MAG: MFS transporter [Rhodobacteraceae bacterium]|nr:MFS transporter [Paracoccaceae bacterium]
MPLALPSPAAAGPEVRTAAFYFVLFAAPGVANSYGGIWFESRGLSAAQIGAVTALPVLITLVVNLMVGRIADRAPDWRQTIVVASLISAVASAMLGFAGGFWGLLAIWTVTVVAQTATVMVLDAAALRMTARTGGDFGALRAWGTVGYLLTIVAAGALVAAFGPAAFVPLFAGGALLRAAVAFALPRFRVPAATADRPAPPHAAAPPVDPVAVPAPQAPVAAPPRRLGQVMAPWFVLPLFGCAVLFGAHSVLNAFQGLLWQRQGLPLDTIGYLIALGGVAETAVFFGFARLLGRFSARHLLLVAGAAGLVRWIAMAMEPGLAWLIPLQAMHGITYGLGFMAVQKFVNTHTSDDIAAQAQGFLMMLTQGVSVAAMLGFGLLVDGFGAASYLAAAVLAVAGTAMVAASLRLRPPVG